MSGRNIETLLAFHCLTGMGITHSNLWYSIFIEVRTLFICLFNILIGPLINNPVSDMDIVVNKLLLKYRTYIAGYEVEEV